MAVLRSVTAEDGGVADVDVMPPSLDELYTHFLRSQDDSR
jgi:Cu-processing system ATP-binding protein